MCVKYMNTLIHHVYQRINAQSYMECMTIGFWLDRIGSCLSQTQKSAVLLVTAFRTASRPIFHLIFIEINKIGIYETIID